MAVPTTSASWRCYQPPPPPGGYPAATAAEWLPAACGSRVVTATPAWGARISAAATAARTALPKEAYTPWFTRVLGCIIDILPGPS